jgi:hypothetical protein
MNHLGDLGQAPLAGAQISAGIEGAGQQQDNAGAQALAAGSEEMLGCRLKDRMASTDQAAQIGKKSIEIALNRLEQLCNRCHNTSLEAGS